ncbi:MAG TPA: hypothetical protein VHF89_06220, partial [Solirubrobacteraceae bacterium]|nr:hypothetical protein [Solirubrobacteraceae bacterium]
MPLAAAEPGPPPPAPLTAATFEALYRATVEDLFAYVAAVVRDRGVAEDVVAAAPPPMDAAARAALDERVASAFARPPRARRRWHARVLVPALGTAAAAVVALVAVLGAGGGDRPEHGASGAVEPASPGASDSRGAGAAASRQRPVRHPLARARRAPGR